MNTNSLITFFQGKIAEIDKLNGLDSDNVEFQKWRDTTLNTCKRMGGDYSTRFNDIRYTPGSFIIGGDNSGIFARAYNKGLQRARALLESFVEELETWGYDGDSGDILATEKPKNIQQPVMNLNISQSQTQSQSASISISLSAYDEKTQEKLKELAGEIRKPNNYSKVAPIVKWLANKSTDALIALLPSMIKFG